MKAIEILCLSIRRNEPEIYDGRESLQLLALLQYFADALNQRQDERSKEKELMYLSSLLQNPNMLGPCWASSPTVTPKKEVTDHI